MIKDKLKQDKSSQQDIRRDDITLDRAKGVMIKVWQNEIEIMLDDGI